MGHNLSSPTYFWKHSFILLGHRHIYAFSYRLCLLSGHSNGAEQLQQVPYRDFPGGPVAKTLCFKCRECGLIHTQGQGIRVSKLGLHMPCSQKTETNKQKKQTADGPQYFKTSSTWSFIEKVYTALV